MLPTSPLPQFLDRTRLKLIAILLMTLNHIGVMFYPRFSFTREFLTGLGYSTAPIMLYLLVQGYYKTHSLIGYAERLLLFGLLSEPAYIWAFFSDGFRVEGSLNMILTLFLCFFMVWILETHPEFPVPAVLACTLLASVFFDWAVFAPLYVFFFRKCEKEEESPLPVFFGGALLNAVLTVPLYSGALPPLLIFLYSLMSGGLTALSGLLYMVYDPDRAEPPGSGRLFFYLYYPLHLALLCFIRG